MKIRCLHGYFIFEETKAGQVSDFMSLFDLALVADGRAFTFAALADAPSYSIAGGLYLGALATKTFEGDPWEVMEANGLVYNFSSEVVQPIALITQQLQVDSSNNYFVSPGLILPGSIATDGSRVTDYAAFYVKEVSQFKYSEISYE